MDAADARELLVLLSDSDAWHLILAECRHTSEAENCASRSAVHTDPTRLPPAADRTLALARPDARCEKSGESTSGGTGKLYADINATSEHVKMDEMARPGRSSHPGLLPPDRWMVETRDFFMAPFPFSMTEQTVLAFHAGSNADQVRHHTLICLEDWLCEFD
jgi:hypothetical protein